MFRTMAVVMAMVSAGWLLALAGTAQEAEATFPGSNGMIAFASNRSTTTNPEGDYEVFTMNPDGSELKQLTENASFDFDPEWSPDGEKIAFESRRDGFSEIFVMNADGSEAKNLTNAPAGDFTPDWQPRL